MLACTLAAVAPAVPTRLRAPRTPAPAPAPPPADTLEANPAAAAAYREALLGYDLALMRAYHTHDEHNKTTILPLLTIAANDGVEEG